VSSDDTLRDNPQYALVCAAVAARRILYYMNGAEITLYDGTKVKGSVTLELAALDEALEALGHSPFANHSFDRPAIAQRLQAKRDALAHQQAKPGSHANSLVPSARKEATHGSE
jgi:hypothetical protein